MRRLILSCEHATNHIPEQYLTLFAPFQAMLHSHQGFDEGSLSLANYLNQHLPSELTTAKVSRLLVDCNRSLHHQHCFSAITKALPAIEKQYIIKQYYAPYRQTILKQIEQNIAQGQAVLHLSVHSFTPILNNKIRKAAVGLLYDPARTFEKQLATLLKHNIQHQFSYDKIRMNYPYKGISDGLTTAMRRIFAEDEYLGLEIEVNQKLVKDPLIFSQLQTILVSCLLPLIAKM
jgi:predicted N-formylglutamate amidohydrolase